MKTRFIFVGIIIFVCTGTIKIGYAVTPKYATPSHKDITEISILYFKNKGGNLLVNVLDQDIIKMREGSSHEDTPPRWVNHFYDFFHGSGYLAFDSSKKWVHDNAAQSGLFLGSISYHGDHTWEAAVNSYKARDISAAFYHLGHVVHLIQDLTIPAHTRDDFHYAGTINYNNTYTFEYEDYINNKIHVNGTNILNSILDNSNMLEFDSLENYFDYLSNYTQRNFYSGDSITGTVFSLKYSTDGTEKTIFPGYSNPHAEQYDGEAYYFRNGKDPDGTGEIRLAYRAYVFPITGFEIWSAEHPAIYEDTWQRAGKLAMCATAGVVNLFLKEVASNTPPGAISVNPASGSWTSTPQNLAVSSSGATAIYYTMVNTTDGSTPADPREPTSSDNDGSISVSGGTGTFQFFATAGQNKRSKLRFRGYNNAGAGPASGVYSYSINLSSGLPTNAEFNGQIDAFTSYLFYSDNTLAYSFKNSSSLPMTFSVKVSPGKYKIVSVMMQGNTQEQGYAMYDQLGNNVFELANGAIVTIGSSMPNSIDGRVVKNITGSNYTGTYEPPLDLSGVWDTTETITASSDPGYRVGDVVIAVDNITQTGNRVDRYNSTTQMMFTGCINGNVIYVSIAFNAWGWNNKYTETMVVNDAGNYMTGTNQQTGTAPLSPGYMIASNVVRTKRP